MCQVSTQITMTFTRLPWFQESKIVKEIWVNLGNCRVTALLSGNYHKTEQVLVTGVTRQRVICNQGV